MFQTTNLNLNLSTCTEKIFPCFEENSWTEGIRGFSEYAAGSLSRRISQPWKYGCKHGALVGIPFSISQP